MSYYHSFDLINLDENRSKTLKGVSEIKANSLAEIQYKLQIDHLQKTSKMRRLINEMVNRYHKASKMSDAMNREISDLTLQVNLFLIVLVEI